jgi:hypothetical protein
VAVTLGSRTLRRNHAPHGVNDGSGLICEKKDGGKKKARRRWKTPSTGLEKCWLPICNRLRTRPEVVEPEVWFRIVHLAQVGQNRPLFAPYCEQTVAVAIGPIGV